LVPRADLQEIVARSSVLPSKDSIQVMTDGPAIVLEGTVTSEREARLAEMLLRLSPGVRLVRNELTLQQARTAAAR
jgi:osmotically-inducible protein OsmY